MRRRFHDKLAGRPVSERRRPNAPAHIFSFSYTARSKTQEGPVKKEMKSRGEVLKGGRGRETLAS